MDDLTPDQLVFKFPIDYFYRTVMNAVPELAELQRKKPKEVHRLLCETLYGAEYPDGSGYVPSSVISNGVHQIIFSYKNYTYPCTIIDPALGDPNKVMHLFVYRTVEDLVEKFGDLISYDEDHIKLGDHDLYEENDEISSILINPNDPTDIDVLEPGILHKIYNVKKLHINKINGIKVPNTKKIKRAKRKRA